MGLYAQLCGAILARAHARSGDRIAIAGYLGGGDTFDRAIAEFAAAYADQNEDDYRTKNGRPTTAASRWNRNPNEGREHPPRLSDPEGVRMLWIGLSNIERPWSGLGVHQLPGAGLPSS